METFYLVCAGLGGTVLVLQVAAGALGHGGDHDAGHDGDLDHDGNGFVGALGVRTVASALTFFGLGGLTAGHYGVNGPSALGAAVGAGAAAFATVAYLVRSLARLRADGTVRIDRSVGRTGSVYLRVPGSKAGAGKVHLALQGRTVEYQAVTAGPDLPTGAAARVVAVVGADTVEVEAA